MNRISRIFQPTLILPKNAVVKHQDLTSKSQKLMIDCGILRHCGNGTFYILPILQRSIEKLIKILDQHMRVIDGQRLTMPTLISAEFWKKSGRFEDAKPELMMMKDRHDKLQILSPTHEESITNLIAQISPVTYRNFPLRLYQITPKFRDEMKPRFGLIRAKEFLMKDLYTFDVSLEAAQHTYEEVNEQYARIFQRLEIPYVKINADTGVMGGKTSHEYQILTGIGEDEIVQCKACSRAINKELCLSDGKICEKCQEENLSVSQGIEIAHTFILEDKYSKILKATFLSKSGKPEVLQMGCYGIGVTRLIAASVELLSTEHEIRWPRELAPFTVCLIPPKEGSKEEAGVKHLTEEIHQQLGLGDEIVVDDRTSLTIGKRLIDAKKLGIPYVIVIGGKIEGKVELHEVNKGVSCEISVNDAVNAVRKDLIKNF